ncbi:MAG: NUDIX hydrolase [Deltaproteobacteria bacterium]|nr:NUDIX hydrolase [Deltaproteobacteria bacterium]
MDRPAGPSPTVDVVLLVPGDRVVLVERRYPPLGWALPGGFVDVGETLEAAAVREAREETGLEVRLLDLVGCYSDPRRDARRHTVTAAFLASAVGEPRGGDDAARAQAFGWDALPPLCFDHAEILADARRLLLTGARRRP